MTEPERAAFALLQHEYDDVLIQLANTAAARDDALEALAREQRQRIEGHP
jgi:hypothetical protein